MDEASSVYLFSIRFEQRDQVFAPFQLVVAWIKKKKKKDRKIESDPLLSFLSPCISLIEIRETRPITATVLEYWNRVNNAVEVRASNEYGQRGEKGERRAIK